MNQITNKTVRFEVIRAILLKIQIIWDVMLCCQTLPDILKDCSVFTFRVRHYSSMSSPQRWRYYDL